MLIQPTTHSQGPWVPGFRSNVIKIINHKPRTMPAHYSAHYNAGCGVRGSRLFILIPLPLWPEESFFAAQPVEFQPFPETFGVFLLHQEKPAESGIFLR